MNRSHAGHARPTALTRPRILALPVAVLSLVALAPAGLLAAPSDPAPRGEKRLHERGKHLDRELQLRFGRPTALSPGARPICDGEHRHRRSCGCVERIRPGHYEIVEETVRSPGRHVRRWVPGPRVRFGRHVRVGLCGGHYERVWVPGEVRVVQRRVWVPEERILERSCFRHRPRVPACH